jgi:hypothetical protein
MPALIRTTLYLSRINGPQGVIGTQLTFDNRVKKPNDDQADKYTSPDADAGYDDAAIHIACYQL